MAFLAAEQLKVVPLAGGVVRTLADPAGRCCISWGPDGFIYYSPVPERNIRRVLATGGADEVVTERGEEVFHGFFQLLPGGEVAVFSTTIPPYRVEAMRMSTGERKVITEGVKPYYTYTGHLVFAGPDGQIVAAPFDPMLWRSRVRRCRSLRGSFSPALSPSTASRRTGRSCTSRAQACRASTSSFGSRAPVR